MARPGRGAGRGHCSAPLSLLVPQKRPVCPRVWLLPSCPAATSHPPRAQSCGFGSGCCEDSLWLPQGLGNLGEDRSHSLRALLVAVGLVGRVVLLKLKGLALEAPLCSGDLLPTVLCCQLPCVVASHPNIRLFSRDMSPGLGARPPQASGIGGPAPCSSSQWASGFLASAVTVIHFQHKGVMRAGGHRSPAVVSRLNTQEAPRHLSPRPHASQHSESSQRLCLSFPCVVCVLSRRAARSVPAAHSFFVRVR